MFLVLLSLLLSSVWACGANLKLPFLSQSDRLMLRPPAPSNFNVELNRVLVQMPKPVFRARRIHTKDGIIQDMSQALSDSSDADALVERWLRERDTLGDDERYPLEFRLYIKGLRELYPHGGEKKTSQAWSRLWRLPKEQRKYRSVWASYMMGNILRGEESLAHYQDVRKWVRAGAQDTLGLAAASYRQEAYRYLELKRYGDAIASCLLYRRAGGRVHCRHIDDWVVLLMKSDEKTMMKAAQKPIVVALISAFLISRNHDSYHFDLVKDEQINLWLTVLSKARIRPIGADRLAWFAYQRGRYALAKKWSNIAQKTPLGRRITSKIALREGDLERATRELEIGLALAPAIGSLASRTTLPMGYNIYTSHNELERSWEELGALYVAQNRFVDGIRAFMEARSWADVAWLAERVLTVEELSDIMQEDQLRPEFYREYGRCQLWERKSYWANTPDDMPSYLRRIFVRRLVREKNYRQARLFLRHNRDWRYCSTIEEAISAVEAAEKSEASGTDFWQAAQLTRTKGWMFQATEMEPDYGVFAGNFQLKSTSLLRQEPEFSEENAVPPTPEEIARLRGNPAPQKRYHFVWTAADYGWEAAQKMDASDPQFAQAACMSGNWLKVKDPSASDKFWKLLGQKGRGTALGKAVLQNKWWWGLNEKGGCSLPKQTVEDERK
ncbi:MAG: hypothetical protein VX278_12205 [Myxococcota bacterium]|nr:hypothetical protein [Myxococcota bacterium]